MVSTINSAVYLGSPKGQNKLDQGTVNDYWRKNEPAEQDSKKRKPDDYAFRNMDVVADHGSVTDPETEQSLVSPKAANDTWATDRIPSEGPQHRVRFTRPFYLGKYEVTQAQWQAVMGSNPSNFKANPAHPVDQVSWDDIQPFLAKLNEGASASGDEVCVTHGSTMGICLPRRDDDVLAQWRQRGRDAGTRLVQCELWRQDTSGRAVAAQCVRALRPARQRAGVV
jgi:hypothetical protein